MYEKYIIEEFFVDGQRYKSCTPKTMREYFSIWRKSLTVDERKALRKYRKKLTPKNNVNAKLRNRVVTRDAEIISGALKRAVIPEPIVVYRSLAKEENINMSNLQEGSVFVCLDFKGTHIGRAIRDWHKTGHFMLILIPPTVHAAYINNTTFWFAHERELLIDKGQYFKLLEKCKIFGRDGYIVKIENAPC